jgi:hypothetical protein
MTALLYLAAGLTIGAAWNWDRARYWRTECLAAEHDIAAPSRRHAAIGPGVPLIVTADMEFHDVKSRRMLVSWTPTTVDTMPQMSRPFCVKLVS